MQRIGRSIQTRTSYLLAISDLSVSFYFFSVFPSVTISYLRVQYLRIPTIIAFHGVLGQRTKGNSHR